MENSGIGFERDIRPLFRGKDIESMTFRFDLSSYDDVRSSSDRILSRLADGSMPCDESWPPERVELFRQWVKAGCPA